MMANAVEMQQLLMSMDPSSANQFNAMNKGASCVLTTSGGSASPTSSSGAPSSSSLLGEVDEKDQMQPMLQNGLGGNAFLSMLLQQQNMAEPKLKPTVTPDFAEMMSNPQSFMEMLSQNGDISKFAAQLALHNKSNETDSDEHRDQSPSPPPAVTLNSSLAAMMLPTTSTSTGGSAASTTSSVDSTSSSVIVNGASTAASGLDEEDIAAQQPTAKKQKTEEETPATPTSSNNQLMQTLLAQIGLGTPIQQQTPKQMKEELLFGGLFPQALSSFPLAFQSPLHQQFAGIQDFEPLSALGTPNKGQAVKRQYSSNGKNYCDICNKEVCNKYFLRTHMLKMHGIVIDENKTVIANIDTSVKEREGELSFRCDTCRTMFKTRNELRQHRHNVHGVLPLSTPRNNQNKPSLPSTPTAGNNNSGPNSAPLDEKCQYCDKRVSPALMMAHVTQDHMDRVVVGTPTDLTQMLVMMNQAAARSSVEEKDSSLVDCTECSYKTRDAKNLELHLERHHKMNDAKQREEEEDVALKMTTEAALHMVVQNQSQLDGDANAAALNLTFKNDGVKKEGEEEKVVGTQHERNSHTSGSISPSGSIPEGFGKAIGDKIFPLQTFLVRSNDNSGFFLSEFVAQLPVREIVNEPRQIVLNLLPSAAAPI